MYTLRPVTKLTGQITIPGDKSISHRAVMFGSLSKGDSCVTGFLNSADCMATMDCFQKLGVKIDIENGNRLVIHGNGLHGLKPLEEPVLLSTQNSGTTTRIMSGILAPQKFTSILSGDESVNKRPMKRVMDPLRLMGADIISVNDNNCAPLMINGRTLHGIEYRTAVASAQVKSSILCAGLYADGVSTVIEPSRSRDHTERMLTAYGAEVKSEILSDGSNKAVIKPADELYPVDVTVPGDISSAAYFIAAASIVPGSELLLKNVGINPTRDGIIKVAKAMGADIEYVSRNDCAEPYADLLVRSAKLHGTVIEGDIIPALIDELPVIAVMAAMAEGTTIIRDAAELKVKESDRIMAVSDALNAMGGKVTPTEDGMIIEGTGHLHGAAIKTYKDHRIAMSFAIASLVAEGETILDDETCVKISYPEFFNDLYRLAD